MSWKRILMVVVVTMLLAGVVGLTLSGCVIVPVPVGGGHRHHERHW